MRRHRHAFSLVEVAIALGVFAFAVLSVIGLLSVALKSNQVSLEETRAALMLTMLEADLRNTRPASNSAIFQLPIPYAISTLNTNDIIFNPAVSAGDFFTTGVDNAEQPVALTGARPRFQASVTYLEVPPTNSLKPIIVRLAVNWPGTNTLVATDVLDLAKVSGFVEATISFPAP